MPPPCTTPADARGRRRGSSLERPQRCPEVLQHPHGIARRLAQLRVAIPVERDALEQRYELPPGILLDEEVPHVDLADAVLDQFEIFLEAAILEVFLVRVPAHPQRRWLAGVLQDPLDPWYVCRFRAVDFQLD